MEEDHSESTTILDLVKTVAGLYSTPIFSQLFLEWFLDITHSAESKSPSAVILSRSFSTDPTDEIVPARVDKVMQTCCEKLKIGALIYQVEKDYYSWDLLQRALRAPSIDHLCKCVIFENTHFDPVLANSELDPDYSRYYCVIVQYTGSINTQKLMNEIRIYKAKEIPKKNYNFRLAPEDKAAEMTGFLKNGVSPIAMVSDIPIIIDDRIMKLKPSVAYLGAGHVDWKICVRLDDLVSSVGARIANLD